MFKPQLSTNRPVVDLRDRPLHRTTFWVTVEETGYEHNRAEVFHSYQAAVTHAWEVRADGRRVAVVDFEGWDLPPNGLVIEPAAIVGRAVGVIDLRGRVWVKPAVNRFARPAAAVEQLVDEREHLERVG